jgi:hypothetical protein
MLRRPDESMVLVRGTRTVTDARFDVAAAPSRDIHAARPTSQGVVVVDIEFDGCGSVAMRHKVQRCLHLHSDRKFLVTVRSRRPDENIGLPKVQRERLALQEAAASRDAA